MEVKGDGSNSATILVVEDEQAVAGFLARSLSGAGYIVAVAPSGADALARLDAGGIDLVLLDVGLPDMDGREVCRQIRQLEEEDVLLPVIMLTGLIADHERHAGFIAGADDYVCKPFRLDDLLDRVRVWIRTRQRVQTAHKRLLHQALKATAHAVREDMEEPLLMLRKVLDARRAPASPSSPDVEGYAQLSEAAEYLAERVKRLSHAERYFGDRSSA